MSNKSKNYYENTGSIELACYNLSDLNMYIYIING